MILDFQGEESLKKYNIFESCVSEKTFESFSHKLVEHGPPGGWALRAKTPQARGFASPNEAGRPGRSGCNLSQTATWSNCVLLLQIYNIFLPVLMHELIVMKCKQIKTLRS